MRKRACVGGLCGIAFAAALGVPVQAQTSQSDIDTLQGSVALYAGVLQEGLGLNVRTGLFSPLGGTVRGLYLAQQGVVLEISSPLANSRNSFAEFTLGAALERLSSQFSAFSTDSAGAVPRPDLTQLRESMAMSMRGDLLQGPSRDLLEELNRMDLSAAINSALQRAADAARSLHALAQLEDADLNALLAEIDGQRARVNEQIAVLQGLRTQISAQTAPALEAQVQQWRAALQDVAGVLEPLQDSAHAQAQRLQERAALARSEREQQWLQEVTAFESTLMQLACDYAGGLRALPPQEHVTFVLQGLGEDTAQRREDRVLVLRQADALRCLQREITAQQLLQTARAYSF